VVLSVAVISLAADVATTETVSVAEGQKVFGPAFSPRSCPHEYW
jgi:hypothetical protein